MSIFEGFLSTSETLAAFSDRNFVDAMLRFEAALARAQAQVGLIPESAAHSIVGSCKVELFDVAKIVRDSGRAGSVAIPLVKSLKEAVGLFNAEAVRFVHFGSTSQDVIDTAMALVTREAVALVEEDLSKAAQALLQHAQRYATAPILARTLMQPASVTSFGFKCVGWAAPLVRSKARLAEAAGRALNVQLGGAVGTLSQMKGQGPEVRRHMAQALGLGDPGATWHTQRDEWIALGCELGLMVGSLGKIAKDIALMGQYEVGELAEPSEPGRGGSSAMPHKRNPVASMVALAAAQRAPQRVAALLSAMPQEHERALGAWQAELAEWPQLLMSAHGSVRALAGALPGLQVDVERMRSNIERLRAELPRDAADEWFDAALAEPAGAIALAQALALQAQLNTPDTAR
ncbi:3-carboxy-cis,cis-muconate cycloisomerase [Variovorax sp. J22P240]|uniref:3-carboxy-cis,cis-muconate cycloisomerase n=1 Tax=Variovorax sp. J22P240 TaxID=3053514 RepID=UPI002576268A|nr:3-carboxy-cis,cis-muconate cycloisomerase [Variovorax sp. J22P240]MDM0002863.1 3-carboxy-cis,cis-muconate cycloisomerase [Variovorax sp. J22P240]